LELERLLLCEEISWRQKSRALWLREEDKNTKFFHRVANSNKRNNAIESLIMNGSLYSEATDIKRTLFSSTPNFSLKTVVGGLYRMVYLFSLYSGMFPFYKKSRIGR
jgi:hypothetical protein